MGRVGLGGQRRRGSLVGRSNVVQGEKHVGVVVQRVGVVWRQLEQLLVGRARCVQVARQQKVVGLQAAHLDVGGVCFQPLLCQLRGRWQVLDRQCTLQAQGTRRAGFDRVGLAVHLDGLGQLPPRCGHVAQQRVAHGQPRLLRRDLAGPLVRRGEVAQLDVGFDQQRLRRHVPGVAIEGLRQGVGGCLGVFRGDLQQRNLRQQRCIEVRQSGGVAQRQARGLRSLCGDGHPRRGDQHHHVLRRLGRESLRGLLCGRDAPGAEMVFEQGKAGLQVAGGGAQIGRPGQEPRGFVGLTTQGGELARLDQGGHVFVVRLQDGVQTIGGHLVLTCGNGQARQIQLWVDKRRIQLHGLFESGLGFARCARLHVRQSQQILQARLGGQAAHQGLGRLDRLAALVVGQIQAHQRGASLNLARVFGEGGLQFAGGVLVFAAADQAHAQD